MFLDHAKSAGYCAPPTRNLRRRRRLAAAMNNMQRLTGNLNGLIGFQNIRAPGV